MPLEIVDGETPLIVSLHGYGGDSAYHTAYVPLHERVNTDGFALLLPNPESTDRSLTGRAAGLAESSAGVAAFAGRCRGRTGARSRRSARLGGAEGAGARVREACAGMLARASDPGRRCERASGRER